ncbi:EF-hand domain-containing protein D2 homolog isoform X2 [Tubulanus polymorphus]|uniref:EF-hand domain-containing protein D2 homolog isoform X2 n=1 Tax=Tubulanus polymorphus TaxID=672921 RepID=UPI003DA45625
MASPELQEAFDRQEQIAEGKLDKKLTDYGWVPTEEYRHYTLKDLKRLKDSCIKYDADNNKYLDLMEMKVLMEKLGVPQTHIGLKSMIAEVDEDNDGVISFREFLLIFRKAQLGELEEGSGLLSLVRLSEIDVGEVGVKGAKSFFECKIKDQTDSNKFENEIKQEQEERRREEEEAKARKEAFKQKAANFDGL